MKKSALFVLPLLMVVSFSCVSNGKYNEFEYQYSRLKEEKQSIENEYSSLVCVFAVKKGPGRITEKGST